ncbi:MAG: EF-hand domain-containing protein [Planctomycetaceae bacterium]
MRRTVGQADVGSLPAPVLWLLATTARRGLLCVGAVAVASNHLTIGVVTASEPDVADVGAAFEAADVNHDRLLSLEEFTAQPGDANVYRRDFRLMDVDRNGRLTPEEVATVADPMDHLLDAALAALEEGLRQGGRDAVSGLQTKTFVFLAVGSLAPDGRNTMDEQWLTQADPNQDGQVSPNETERFLEIHLGILAPTGERLRDRRGRVVNSAAFIAKDENRDWALTRKEFVGAQDNRWLEEVFESLDQDRDGLLTVAEFGTLQGVGYDDVAGWFRDADTNLDAHLDVREAVVAVLATQRVLIPICFRVFDGDNDGRLSFDEYRLSMLANPIASWEEMPRDQDDDYLLSFEEFRFGAAQCELLRLYYFHKLDANGDNKLSQTEFAFRTQPGRCFHLLAADGSEMRLLHARNDYPHCGSPAVSPDGKTVAFDGRHGGLSLRQQRILMMSIDGTGFRDVCEGLMPTWSPDGKRFACSRYEPAGIWIVDADGANAQRLADGWAAQWSPDGGSIAFTNDNGIWTYDVASGAIREVFAASQHTYRTIYWNMCWSPDSRRLVFKARTDNGADIVSINMVSDDPDLRVHYSGDGSIEPDTAWSPDGRRIVFSMESPGSSQRLLYELDPTTDDPPVPVKGTDTALTYKTSCFTPDGKWIIAATMDLEGQPRNADLDQ